MLIPVVVFFSGASVMMVELVGSRIIAPYVGNSIHAWTALLSVILGSLSLGYAIGGKLADRFPSYTVLSGIFLLSACAVSIIKTLEWLLLPITVLQLDIRLLAVILSIVLFSFPSVLLGMISPYTIRLSIRSLSGTGRTAGNLNALSTIGSIVGTVVTGFYLLGNFGHATVLNIVAGILVFCGISMWFKGKRTAMLVLCLAGFPVFWMNQFSGIQHPLGIERETEYQRIFIRDIVNVPRPIRALAIDLYGIQSAMFLDQDTDLVAEYTKVFRVSDAFVPKPDRVLMIGGAGYAYPKDFLRRHPAGIIDVVEIDPGMTAVAKEWFNLPESDRLNIFHADGRVFLSRTNHQYDVIYFDAFGELVTPPFHLLTQEMMELVKQRLRPDGVYVMNIIGAYEGPNAKLISAIYETLQRSFPSLSVYAVHANEAKSATQNIIVVAAMSADQQPSTVDPQVAEMLARQTPFSSLQNVSVLTDSFAPVEQYAMDMLR